MMAVWYMTAEHAKAQESPSQGLTAILSVAFTKPNYFL